MVRYSKPVWQMLLGAAEHYGELTSEDAIHYIDEHYPADKVNRGTIRAQLIAASFDHPSAKHFADPNRFLMYLGKGKYRLFKPSVDGAVQMKRRENLAVDKSSKETLPFARVAPGYRISLPLEIVQKLSLQINDIIAFMEEDGKITLHKARLELALT
jgi:hypothetical protein